MAEVEDRSRVTGSKPGPGPLVGLTGGIGSGKSTVGRLLREGGLTVIDADELVAELYEPGAAGCEVVAELFGDDLLDGSGAVDRERLASRVFSDPEARRRLESRIHPLVGQRFGERAATATGPVVFEVPLLVESGGAERFDLVVTVEADPELRTERAIARGLDRPAAEARIAAQASSAERTAVADFVIDNNGSLEALAGQVEKLLDELGRSTQARKS